MWNKNMTLAEEGIIRQLILKVHKELVDKKPLSDAELHTVAVWENLCHNIKVF